MATRSQFDLKIAIRLVAVPLAAATATATQLKLRFNKGSDKKDVDGPVASGGKLVPKIFQECERYLSQLFKKFKFLSFFFTNAHKTNYAKEIKSV